MCSSSCMSFLQWMQRESLPARSFLAKGPAHQGCTFLPACTNCRGTGERTNFRAFAVQAFWCPAPPGPHHLSEAISDAGSKAAGAPEPWKQSFSIPTRNEGEEESWTKINNFWLLWIKACYNQNSPPSAAKALGPRLSKIMCVLEATGKVSSTEKTLLVSKGAGECFKSSISVPGSPGACVDSLFGIQPGVG